MDYANLQLQAASLKKSLFDQGYLDEQFCQVEDLRDEASPHFTEEVVCLFFEDSTRLMTNFEQAMEKYPRDFNRWDAYMQQLKGSCSSVGYLSGGGEKSCFPNNCPKSISNWRRERHTWPRSFIWMKIIMFSIGASRMKNECTLFRNGCGDENAESCIRSFQKLKREHAVLRQKLESYFQLLRQAGPAGTPTRPRGM